MYNHGGGKGWKARESVKEGGVMGKKTARGGNKGEIPGKGGVGPSGDSILWQ